MLTNIAQLHSPAMLRMADVMPCEMNFTFCSTRSESTALKLCKQVFLFLLEFFLIYNPFLTRFSELLQLYVIAVIAGVKTRKFMQLSENTLKS